MSIKKILGAVGISLLVINLVLFSFRVYSATAFWIILAILGAFSYIFLKLLK